MCVYIYIYIYICIHIYIYMHIYIYIHIKWSWPWSNQHLHIRKIEKTTWAISPSSHQSGTLKLDVFPMRSGAQLHGDSPRAASLKNRRSHSWLVWFSHVSWFHCHTVFLVSFQFYVDQSLKFLWLNHWFFMFFDGIWLNHLKCHMCCWFNSPPKFSSPGSKPRWPLWLPHTVRLTELTEDSDEENPWSIQWWTEGAIWSDWAIHMYSYSLFTGEPVGATELYLELPNHLIVYEIYGNLWSACHNPITHDGSMYAFLWYDMVTFTIVSIYTIHTWIRHG